MTIWQNIRASFLATMVVMVFIIGIEYLAGAAAYLDWSWFHIIVDWSPPHRFFAALMNIMIAVTMFLKMLTI